jgi:hypothetical protein
LSFCLASPAATIATIDFMDLPPGIRIPDTKWEAIKYRQMMRSI